MWTSTVPWIRFPGRFRPHRCIIMMPSLKEVNSNTATIRLDYMVTADSGDGKTEYYKVSEYYLQNTEERIMLLDFERDVSQIFDPKQMRDRKGTDLGINSRDIEYKNDAETGISDLH